MADGAIKIVYRTNIGLFDEKLPLFICTSLLHYLSLVVNLFRKEILKKNLIEM